MIYAFAEARSKRVEDWEIRPTFTERWGPVIDERMRSSLIQSFSEEDVWNVMKSHDRNKSPGPDGLNMLSIKKGWGFMKRTLWISLVRFIQSFSEDEVWNVIKSCDGKKKALVLMGLTC